MSDSGLHELAEEARKLREALAPASHGNVTQMVMPPPTDGERAVHRVEKVAYLLAGLLLGAVFGFGLYISSIKSDTQETRDKQERVQDYLNMLWRNYPETRKSALEAKEKENQSVRNPK